MSKNRYGKYLLNESMTRAIDISPAYGIACYQRKYSLGDDIDLHHCGVVNSLLDARRWLRFQQPDSLCQVYKDDWKGKL